MQTLPQNIRVGMRVLDSAGNEIGKIDDFKFSENADQPDVQPTDIDAADRQQQGGLMEDIAEAFDPDGMPEVLRDRLLSEGYIRLDTHGLFAADRYILPEQIASASGDEVVLNVGKDELMKRN